MMLSLYNDKQIAIANSYAAKVAALKCRKKLDDYFYERERYPDEYQQHFQEARQRYLNATGEERGVLTRRYMAMEQEQGRRLQHQEEGVAVDLRGRGDRSESKQPRM